MCIDIVESWLGIANGQISSILDKKSYLPATHPYFRFRTITWVNINGFSPNLICALILWRSGFGLLMGKFHQFLKKWSACDTSLYSFPDNNLSKYQWIFTKLGICIDIVEIWFWITNGQSSSIFDSYLPSTLPYFCFRTRTWVNINGFSPNLLCAIILCIMCIYIVEIWHGIANGQI